MIPAMSNEAKPGSGSPLPSKGAITWLLAVTLLALGATGLVFLLYVALFYPVGPLQRWDVLSKVGFVLAAGGIFDVVFMRAYLWPLQEALDDLSEGRTPREEVALAASQRAATFPYFGGALTMAFWILGSGGIAWSVSDLLPPDTLVAGALTGLCTGFVSALLVFYFAVGELYSLRALLAGAHPPAPRGWPIGWRILLNCVAVLLVGVAMVGATAYINHRYELERGAVVACERALRALSALEISAQKSADAAATACGGSAQVYSGDQVLAFVGTPELPRSDRVRKDEARVPPVILRSGAVLHARVGDQNQKRQRESFAKDIVAFTVLAVLLAVAVALAASRAITIPVRGLARGAEAVADGDLTRYVPVLTHDEIGWLASSFTAMSAGLRGLVGNISEAASGLTAEVSTVSAAGKRVMRGLEVRREGVAAATREMTDMDHSVSSVGRDMLGLSEHISGASASLAELTQALEAVRQQGGDLDRAVASARAEVQALVKASERVASEIGQMALAAKNTVATIAESGSTLRVLSLAAAESEAVAERVFSQTVAGRKVVEEGVRGVEAIRGVVAEARERVAALGARSTDITAIVDFIAEVAGRTNLLSLNAAIIAAQAGEQGKPFGVVAEHIRDLAAQIGSSTKRIADIIAGVRVEVEATSRLIQQSDELASIGVERAREGGEALIRIAEGTKRAREVSGAIGPAVAAHAESARLIEQLAAGVVEMAEGFKGVELLLRGGKSIDTLAQSLAPLTQRAGRAMEDQAAVSRRQLENLEEINRMIARLNRTVAQHGEGTARVLKNLNELVVLADEDRGVVNELSSAAQTLERHAQALREGLSRFQI
jgi:methyl-accepting chemotaxis protein